MDRDNRTRTIATKVGALHVESRGQGFPVLCWPSLYCDARTLDPMVSDLARDYHVLVIDGPGHGGSEPSPASCSLEDCADAAIQVLDGFGIERAAWVGAAWGGHIGVLAAHRHPERLSILVVLNVPMDRWRGRRLALMRFTYAMLWLFGPRSFIARLIADKMVSPRAGPDRPAMVDIIASALSRCDKAGLLRTAHAAMFERGDLAPVLSKLRAPVIFLTGADDPLLPVEEARRQAAVIPRCRFMIIERSAHQSALESPAQVIPVVRAGLAEWCHTEPAPAGLGQP